MKETTNESQNKRIAAFMLKGGKLTAMDALIKFGCLRLASRINELQETYHITRDWVTLKSGKRVRKYGISF